MSKKYKLVPVEPTPEMLEAGADWCGQGLGTCEAKGRAATAYKFMLAAAPAVQGEPAEDALHARAMGLYTPPFRYDSFGGYIWDSENNMVADNHDLQDDAVLRIRGWGRILYMDDPEALQDKMGELVAAALTAYWAQPAEQQPDVTLLLELLSHARCNTCDGSGGLYDNHGNPHQCQWCHDRSTALAAHRKGGDV